MTHLLDWHLESGSAWQTCIEEARRFAEDRTYKAGVAAGRSLGLLFFNPSLRTRTSMEVAAARLGAHSSIIVPGQGTWGFAWQDGTRMDGSEAEHIREAAGVLSQYFDAIGVRLFAGMTDRAADREEHHLRRFLDAAQVPVVNLESAYWHPCQALADAACMHERFGGDPAGKRFLLTWAYHPKALPTAVPNSALLNAARLGMRVTVARPPGFELDPEVMALARRHATVEETDDLSAAMDGAHVVYAKAWSGTAIYTDPEREAAQRGALQDWRISAAHMAATENGAFMHCLPVRRNVVVDDAVLDGPQALHLRQAAYRLFAQQAILCRAWDL
ncbi:MAG: N-acetylornithine carbamoyltransferase [Rhodothermales bacterium]|nr:N-acetylornithine carbamoyltransferase [Rhodothermales bacterium]MBO6779377.1 N-acetylornithine carbamoyltransferase [Rhodothermales bacterium]